MRTLLNIIWFIFSGFWLGLPYVLAGNHLLLADHHHPVGHRLLPHGEYAAWPFGRELVDKPTAGIFSFIGNVIWVIVAGWWIALTDVATGIVLCITIIGIPLGIANFKLIPVSLMPLGKQIVSKPPRSSQVPVEKPTTTGEPFQTL